MNEIEKYINDFGKECYRGVTWDTPMADFDFHRIQCYEDDVQYVLHTNLGSLTVLNRMTGFGYRDVETGYRDHEGKFWLASGGYDVRHCGAVTFGEAVKWVKENANNCTGQ